MQLKSLAKSTNALDDITTILNNTVLTTDERRTALGTVGKTYTTETLKAAIAQSTLNKEQIKTIMSANGLQGALLETTTDELANAASTYAVASAQNKAAVSTLGLGDAFKGLFITIRSFITNHPVGTILVSIGAVAAGIISYITKTNTISQQELEEMAQKASQAKSNIDSLTSKMRDKAKTVNDIKDRYAELAQGVDRFTNQNKTLSTDEYKEFLDLTNQLSEVFPQLNMGVDDNGNALLNLNGNVNTITSSLESLLETEQRLANQEIADNASEYITNTLPQLKQSYTDLKEQKEQYEEEKKAREKYLNIDSIGRQNNPGIGQVDADRLLTGYEAIQDADYITTDLERFFGVEKQWERLKNKQVGEYGALIEFTEKDKQDIQIAYSRFVTETETQIKKSEAEIARANKEMSSVAGYWYTNELDLKDTDGNAIYDNLQSPELQAALRQMFSDINWTELQDKNEWTDADDLYNYISESILIPLENVSPEIRESVYDNIIKAFTDTSLSSGDRLKLLQDLQHQFTDLGIDIDLSYKTKALAADTETIKDRLGYNRNASGTYDAQRNAVINNVVSELDDSETAVLLNADIPEDIQTYTEEELRKFIQSLCETAENNPVEINVATPLADISSAFSDLGSIYDSIINGETVAADALSKLSEAFGDLDDGNALKKFTQVMATMPGDIEAGKEALNDLATAYINNSDLMENLTEENADYVKSELKKIGIINADAIVEQSLTNKYGVEAGVIRECVSANLSYNGTKLTAANTTDILANATVGEINQMIAEASAAGTSCSALASYAFQKIQAQRTTITTDGDISNLLGLCEALDISTKLVNTYIDVKNKLAEAYKQKVQNGTIRIEDITPPPQITS